MPAHVAPLFDKPPTLSTNRLTIRFVTENDLAALMKINGDDEVTRYLPYASWKSSADAVAWFGRSMQRHRERTVAQFVIERKATAAESPACVIGTALFIFHNLVNECGEIGYVLGRSHWGQGYAQEAVQAMLSYAFATLQLHRLDATVDPRNRASENVLRRQGFQHEGTRRENWLGRDGHSDSALYGLLRRDWENAAKSR